MPLAFRASAAVAENRGVVDPCIAARFSFMKRKDRENGSIERKTAQSPISHSPNRLKITALF
ncbi:hypothetical protein [Burkholderia multivorans]|uniref:hypothetical protein n=1 Tax=Burkholderia multivorans TaxID=87883 RepID=UPI000F516EB9|nr:hypothetical protein [Burkholderia multivorans]MCA8436308.1 hypothetical protein [Burkholderia multivorans]